MKISTKKILLLSIGIILALSLLVGCPATYEPEPEPDENEYHIPMFILTREEGSGTRAAFEQLFANNGFGTHTFENSFDMMFAVDSDFFTIGYVSLGLKDDFIVKAVDINGITPTIENVLNGSYNFIRPLNIVTQQGLSDVAEDFYNFILSAEGQDIIEAFGFARIHQGQPFVGTLPPGLVRVDGSSSMAPVLQELGTAYMRLNRNSNIEVATSNSAVGLNVATAEAIYAYNQASPYNLALHPGGLFDIGMVSREITAGELTDGLNSTTIAHDSIAVIINYGNMIDGLSSETVSAIFNGEVNNWLDPIFEAYRD